MNMLKTLATTLAAAGILATMTSPALAQDTSMGFFVTSVGVGNGANLGGLAGGDAHCQKLATAAGSKRTAWRAYLSTQVTEGRGISARDRIGKGPWYNAKGVLIARDIDELHLNPSITKSTALDENGKEVKGRGDKPNEHDILTGSRDDGTAFFPWEKGDHTCNNWTSTDEKGSAMVGHHDRHGGGNTSWTAAHKSRGCHQKGLESTGGAGLLYCFAAD